MDTREKTEAIIAVFEKFTPVSAACKEWLSTHLHFKKFAKGQYLFEAGNQARSIYFVFSGLVHYYIDHEGASAESDRTACSWFLHEGDIVIPVIAFYTRTKTPENIKALEETETAFLHYEELVYLYTHFPEMNIARAALTEIYRVKERQWHIRLAACSAEENYLYLRQTSGKSDQKDQDQSNACQLFEYICTVGDQTQKEIRGLRDEYCITVKYCPLAVVRHRQSSASTEKK
jgi:CRP/FNR family transcriptional regulator, anaerobic regulatory protein